MKCIHCGAVLPDGACFCPECGNKVESRKECPVCHAFVSAEDNYCMKCGANLISEPDTEESLNGSDNEKIHETVVVRCPKCGKILREEEKICPDCGTRLSSDYSGPPVNMMQCPSCGATISDMNRVCPECGCRLDFRKQAKDPLEDEIDKVSARKSSSRHSVLIVTVLCILLLSFIFFMYLRNRPLGTSEEFGPTQEIEQTDASQDVNIDDEFGNQDEDADQTDNQEQQIQEEDDLSE